jgi:hypothetical protein
MRKPECRVCGTRVEFYGEFCDEHQESDEQFEARMAADEFDTAQRYAAADAMDEEAIR